MDIPEIVDIILQHDDPALMEVSFYEFLMDFSDVKLDYQDDDKEPYE